MHPLKKHNFRRLASFTAYGAALGRAHVRLARSMDGLDLESLAAPDALLADVQVFTDAMTDAANELKSALTEKETNSAPK